MIKKKKNLKDKLEKEAICKVSHEFIGCDMEVLILRKEKNK